jgi:hypothetical protein
MDRVLLVLASALLLAGCQTARPLYYWGHYEALTYAGYVKPDKATAEIQIPLLEEDVQRAAAANLPVHPGLHAQLGLMYSQIGRSDDARREFELEQSLFPESTVLVDHLLNPVKPR